MRPARSFLIRRALLVTLCKSQIMQINELLENCQLPYAKLVWEECPEEYLKSATDYTKLSDMR